MADANSTAGALPARTCQGASLGNSCWAGRGGFGFPDVQSGELYHSQCCGDDSEEYFVSEYGVFQGGVMLSSENRNCSGDGTFACCRWSGAGVYPGYVNAGACVAVCPIVSIGHIRVRGPLGMLKLNHDLRS